MNILKDTLRLAACADSEDKGILEPAPTALNLLVLIPWELR